MKKCLLLLCVVSFFASAVELEGSNLDFMEYPAFSEEKPLPPKQLNEMILNNYREQVEDYASRAQKYVDDANHDIKRILEAQKLAIKQANQAVEEYNRLITTPTK